MKHRETDIGADKGGALPDRRCSRNAKDLPFQLRLDEEAHQSALVSFKPVSQFNPTWLPRLIVKSTGTIAYTLPKVFD